MNKLQEIIEQSYVRIYNGDYDKNYEDTVKETIKDACVEYARSVINIETNPLIELPLSDYIRLESAWDKKHKEMFDRIDKDLLYIKEKKF